MKHIRKFNEDLDNTEKTLRDLIGDIKEEKKVGYYTITETTGGCFVNFDLNKYLDSVVEIHNWGTSPELKEVYIEAQEINNWRDKRLNGYFEGDTPKILSTYPGDERGSFIFNDVFISSGHDGNYLWNVRTGEFKANTW
jgi:hypothetical protein